MAGYYLGASNELLAAITDFSAWFFAWDDRHDRDVVHGRHRAWRRLCIRLHATIDDPHRRLEHPDPLVAALADCLVRLYSCLSGDWNGRFAGHFHPVVNAYDQEFRNRTGGTVPAVADYIELRRLTFAHRLWIDLLEATAGCELPAALHDHPAFQRAAVATQDFAAWYNDLCSLRKELAGGELHNLGISLMRHRGLTEQQAAVEIHRRVRQCVETFLAAEPDVLQLADHAAADATAEGTAYGAAVRSCLFNMRNWFSSVYWFHHHSGRYRVDSWEDRSSPPYIDDPKGRQ
ncbi:hypothetical protein ACGFNU_15730 [Spirillospora sp. NPDC048911]|uniref:terpene synthase family protein n=1 Tax=Spirillospora sp. NPDC048911 TaxID=3364527 RepID=UPI00371AC652